jgi:hypothetical protein
MKMKHSSCREEELDRLRQRYGGRGREGRGRMLDEFCEQYGYERKHAIKLLGDSLPEPTGKARRQTQSKYGGVREVIEQIWRSSEQLCGKRLEPALELWLPHYGKRFGGLLPSQKKLLKKISAATLDRLLAQIKSQVPRRMCATRPGTLLRQQIPIQGEVWNEQHLGFIEADSVAHCGSSLAGDFVWSLTYTCLASGWTEGRAVWNKGAAGVVEQTRDVEASLPFALLGMDFDNGSEWLNWHLVRYLQERIAPVKLTRSRPYHKDDNAHVEQKNWMWPRQLLGYSRLGSQAMVPLINGIYKETWGPLHNFFLPSAKLVKKEREGSRWIREHDRPQTAYQRMLASEQLSGKQRRKLRDLYQSLDPFALAIETEKRLKPILKMARTEI